MTNCESLGECIEVWFAFAVPTHAVGASFVLERERAGWPDVISAGEEIGHIIRRTVTDGREPIGTLVLAVKPRSSTEIGFATLLTERAARLFAGVAAFERERIVSGAFQHAALSTRLPQQDGYRFDAVYQAGRSEAQVGGDWYDAFVTSDGRIVFSIGDVSGSGLNAAIAMLAVRQAIRGIAEVHANPLLIMRAANRVVRTQHPDRFVTAIVAVLDLPTQTLSYVNAGHPPALLREPSGALHQLIANTPPIGLPFDMEREIDVQSAALSPGCVLVFYTDGLIEDSKDIVRGERELQEALAGIDPAHSSIATFLYNTLLPRHARDDVAIMTVAVDEGPPIRRWRFDPVWPDATLRAQSEMEQLLFPEGDNATTFAFQMIFSELIANLLKHAAGTATFILQPGETPVLHVLDQGPGFYFAPHLPYDLFSESGRGLYLISRFAKRFSVEPRPGRGSHTRVALYTHEGDTHDN